MITFDNTEIAFAGKNDRDLQWTYRLFQLIGKPWLVKLSKVGTELAFKLKLPINGIIKKTIFKHFCGGESIDDCSRKIEELAAFNIGTILDYSVEGKSTAGDLDRTRDEIIASITAAANSDSIPFAVFKVTGISKTDLLQKSNDGIVDLNAQEKEDMGMAMARIDAICEAAYEAGIPVFIDAEDSWFQKAIDRIAEAMMAKYNREKPIVYTTLQMYRHDRIAYLNQLKEDSIAANYYPGVKLVRGAYMEKEREKAEKEGYPSPIQPTKIATDHDYNLAMKFLVENIDRFAICAGTHNEDSSQYLIELMEKNNIAKDNPRVYFAQLLGMSDHISYNVAYAGYNVAKYVPYGPIKEVMPYLLRRAQENTSVAGQMGRELSLIVKERKRRKLAK
ncbi:proline dehydrogenase family protein [Crocinitomix catalasitica]|uniref:proline dehydrogenase family protein n=1 Tax=Crocinitomix catalasitica TaxID=184607 RepID=UPI000480FD44|nr:proline dehydrogenase family protein [Crocinitomix catalasitica]